MRKPPKRIDWLFVAFWLAFLIGLAAFWSGAFELASGLLRGRP